ncbi:MAG TPA: 16S rRNA (adenine(1518)-N(6)/adenine(1519)-N(6))-dimethyltransferase RsmA [Nitrospirales bacterium]|nr:16S rRNA (adenine(1518)-N(6)/adenine(1519)-N(6))-dimethyltransferase [Nitrospiraceae bacterium]HNP30047.1 16S rRNA (adenine(1518)-N(6)/adenine(1519)-N(6))-dimethyltransferase RsmA [Nitrospirales bacterium]
MTPLPPYPRKRLGQHFLIDPNLLRKIINLADLQPFDFVCEIGPGGGALTRFLCQFARQVLALEVDPRMVDFLKREFAGCLNLDIQEQDALRYRFDQLPEPAVVVANLPYNISTPILFRLLEARPKIRRMVLTVQLEVAKRLTAKPNTKDYGVLSVTAQHLADVRFGFPVSRKCFRPVPDVDSGVVRLDIRQDHQEKPEDLSRFQRIVRAAFGQRRKTLMNAFRGADYSDVLLESVEKETGISLTRRAETLSVQEYRILSQAFSGDTLASHT